MPDLLVLYQILEKYPEKLQYLLVCLFIYYYYLDQFIVHFQPRLIRVSLQKKMPISEAPPKNHIWTA